MTKKKKKSKLRYIGIVVAILLFLYIGFQVYQMSYNPIKTLTATKETIYDSITKQAVFIRDEDVINASNSGTMVYNVKDGSRVEKGGVIATVFSSEGEANSFAQLESVEKQIAYYENIILQTNAGTTSLEVIDAGIQTSLNNYIRALSTGKLEQMDDYSNSLIDSINNRKVTIGEDIDVNSILNELYAQRKNLESTISKSDSLTSANAGYFISHVNTAQSQVDYSKATELSVSNINNIIKKQLSAEADKNAVGKVIKSFDWYIAVVVDESEIVGVEQNRSVRVIFPQSSVGELSAKVAAINQDSEDAHKVALILKLVNMDESIAKLRAGKVEIRFNEYTGIRVPNDALRAVTEKDKKTGKDVTLKCVYVLSGNVVKKKYVDIVYSGDDFVLAKTNTAQTDHVRMYDRIIIKGEDLQDGKIVRYTPQSRNG